MRTARMQTAQLRSLHRLNGEAQEVDRQSQITGRLPTRLRSRRIQETPQSELPHVPTSREPSPRSSPSVTSMSDCTSERAPPRSRLRLVLSLLFCLVRRIAGEAGISLGLGFCCL